MTREQAPKEMKHLFDTPLYARSYRAPGYRRYSIIEIRDRTSPKVTIIMTKNGDRKNTRFVKVFFKIEDDKLVSTSGVWCTSISEFFLKMEANKILASKSIRAMDQYQYELKCNKIKYPENWL